MRESKHRVVKCHNCKGKGYIIVRDRHGNTNRVACGVCGGKGTV